MLGIPLSRLLSMNPSPVPPRQSQSPSLTRIGAMVLLAFGSLYLMLVAVWLWFSWEDSKRLYAMISMPLSTQRELWWNGVQIPLLIQVGAFLLAVVVYGALAYGFSRRMAEIGRYLFAAGRAQENELPSSGVGEIDQLCRSLSETRRHLKDAAQNRESLLLKAAKAGTYAVRAQDHVVVAADRFFLEMLGRTEKEVVGQPWGNLLTKESRHSSTTQQLEVSELAKLVQQFRGPDGKSLWLALAEYEQLDENGEVTRHGLAIDVSDRERLLAEVRGQSTRLQVLWQIATSRTRSEGEKVRLMLRLGMDTLDMDVAILSEKVGQHFVLAHLVDTLGMFKVDEVCPLEAICNEAGREEKSQWVLDLRDDPRAGMKEISDKYGIHAYIGSPIWVGEQFYGTLVFLRQKPLVEFAQDDIVFVELLAAWFSQMLLQHKQRQKLELQALADDLTGLPNRRAAEMRFSEEIARAKRDNLGFSIATCDLDRFKLINDHYGHVVGDEVLQQVAQVMRHALREGDWVARWGGEEFILFLHHSDQVDAFVAAERIREAIKAHPIKTSEGDVEVTASFGVGVFRPEDEDIAHALSESDSCLYEAKRRGRDCVVVGKESGPGMLWRAGVLQRALKEKRLVAAYQIMVDLKTGRPVADEALARLVMPDGSELAAGEFIEAAEGVNLIHEVDHVITNHAMSRCAVNLLGGHDPGFAHFINLSPQFLARKEFVDELLRVAEQFCSTCDIHFPGFKPAVFEITERQLLSDFDKLRADLQPLLDFGFRLALDDFGSGYSSFLYLAELPVSFLKIEGWMVRNMRHNERVRHMVESMIMLAQKMNITTIAECIEDAETAEMLKNMGVDWGQGYYFGRPEI